MNDKELQSRLNAELSNITWSARNGNAVRRRVNEGGTIMKRKHTFAFVLAMILVLACAATAIAAATSEEFNAWLYQLWPEAAMKLMPVELSCEDKGFRLEVTSASAEGSEILISYTVEDLERKNRLEGLEIYPQVVCYTSSAVEVNKGAEDYDKAAQKLYAAEYVKYTNDLIPPKSDIMTLWWQCFSHFENHDFELFRYFKEYGSQAQTTYEIPGNVIVRQPAVLIHYLMTSMPPIYGLSATGMLTEPSALRLFSKKAMSILGGATTVFCQSLSNHILLSSGLQTTIISCFSN